MGASRPENDRFGLSRAAAFLPEEENEVVAASAGQEVNGEVARKVWEVRALVGRLNMIRPRPEAERKIAAVDPDVARLLDPELVAEFMVEGDPELAVDLEYDQIVIRLRELLADRSVVTEYRKLFSDLAQRNHALHNLMHMYKTGYVREPQEASKSGPARPGEKLDERTRIVVARQIIRLLEEFKNELNAEIQNIHNKVATDRRDYKSSDTKVLGKLHHKLTQCQDTIDRLIRSNHEVAIQLRIDEIANDSLALKRAPRKRRGTGGLVEIPSVKRLLYGDETARNSIIAALRAGQNVELVGPTGTGKTTIGKNAAKIFAEKDPVIVSGGPGVYRSTFYGSPSDIGKRNVGAVIKCIIEDRVFMIDEDNQVDPKQLAEIKYLLGLKPGETFIHPDTGEKFVIPPHFRVMVTRNERGKHHKTRFDLPPEYRREFTNGSFEIPYPEPSEVYDRFFIPKLRNDDGSISLSAEEIGGDATAPGKTSPLLALTKASQKIQTLYKENKLKNGVFELGYLLGILDQWKEKQYKNTTRKGKRFLVDPAKQITFVQYLETKLLEFVNRPIGNQDRKLILQTLFAEGFFADMKGLEEASTQEDGPVFTPAELTTMRKSGSKPVFKKPSGTTLSAREVALLDPYKQREIKEPPHPLEAEIADLRTHYQEFCRERGILPVAFTAHNLEIKRNAVSESISRYVRENRGTIDNASSISTLIEAIGRSPLAEFVSKMNIAISAIEGRPRGRKK